jgi:hypothetical protein
MLSWIFIVLAHWNNSPPHSKNNSKVFGLTPTSAELTIHRTPEGEESSAEMNPLPSYLMMVIRAN